MLNMAKEHSEQRGHGLAVPLLGQDPPRQRSPYLDLKNHCVTVHVPALAREVQAGGSRGVGWTILVGFIFPVSTGWPPWGISACGTIVVISGFLFFLLAMFFLGTFEIGSHEPDWL
jgi:hypothetical protein